MTSQAVSTRRRFFGKAGAMLAAPLAAASAGAAEDADREAREARLAGLEDVEAIRALTRAYASHVNARAHAEVAALFADPAEAAIDVTVRSVAARDFGERDVIELAEGHLTADVRVHCTVRTETPLEPSCPLVDMARQQGDGVIRATEERVLEIACVKQRGAWKVKRAVWREA